MGDVKLIPFLPGSIMWLTLGRCHGDSAHGESCLCCVLYSHCIGCHIIMAREELYSHFIGCQEKSCIVTPYALKQLMMYT
jgi:hypothetical protein